MTPSGPGDGAMQEGDMEHEYPEIPDFIKELIDSGEAIDEIRIDREGRWTHNGEPFANRRIVDFFNRSIARTADGTYVIHYADFTYPITVEDVPIFVTGVRFKGFGNFESITLTLTNGAEEELDASTLFYRDNCLYCHVCDGRMPARFHQSPSFQILERLEETDDMFYVVICGKRIILKEKAGNEE